MIYLVSHFVQNKVDICELPSCLTGVQETWTATVADVTGDTKSVVTL